MEAPPLRPGPPQNEQQHNMPLLGSRRHGTASTAQQGARGHPLPGSYRNPRKLEPAYAMGNGWGANAYVIKKEVLGRGGFG